MSREDFISSMVESGAPLEDATKIAEMSKESLLEYIIKRRNAARKTTEVDCRIIVEQKEHIKCLQEELVELQRSKTKETDLPAEPIDIVAMLIHSKNNYHHDELVEIAECLLAHCKNEWNQGRRLGDLTWERITN